MLADKFFGKKPARTLKKGLRRKDQRRGRALHMEELEDRRVLATFIVNNLGDLDNGAPVVGSLRQAIQLSNASPDDTDTIVFADFIFTDPDTRETAPGIISVEQPLAITDEVQILGPGSQTLTIAATGNIRVFDINIGADDEVQPVTIGGVTITGGSLTGTADSDANRGGAILNREGLTLVETVFEGNSASFGGGAVYSPIGNVNVQRSLFTGNSSGGGGGAILLGTGGDDVRPGLTVIDSTFTQNQTFTTGTTEPRFGYGGAIYNQGGNLTIETSTILSNNASAGGGGVATNGIADTSGEVAPIRTQITHSVLYFNTGLPTLDDPEDFSDDIFPVRNNIEGAPLAPTLDLDYLGGYNFIGHLGGGALRGDPNNPEPDLMDPDNTNPLDNRRFHFYEVARAPEGIAWNTAQQFTNFQGPNSVHLASISGNAPGDLQDPYDPVVEAEEENNFIFSLIDDPQYWVEFVPTEPMDAVPPPQNIGPWIGGIQTAFDAGADGGWEWVTTDADAVPPIEPFNFDAWAAGQPDDAVLITEPEDPPVPVPVQENRIAFFDPDSPARSATWGDLAEEPGDGLAPIAFVVEYEPGNNRFGLDPGLLALGDYGGSTQVFYPDSFGGSPLIDGGDPGFAAISDHDQRGVHFDREFGGAIDIGAVEVQVGLFTVDTLFDETDGQYAAILNVDGDDVVPGAASYEVLGDFALREALEFVEKNPEFDIIDFSDDLLLLNDPTASPAPTIELKLTSEQDVRSSLAVTASVTIIGPTGFELEIDATGTDPTPTVDDAAGTRIFLVDNGTDAFASSVSISGLTLLGGDVVGDGGAILNREDLTLDSLRIKENFASVAGGGISTIDGELTVVSSALFDNQAGFQGGGLFVDGATAGNLSRATVRNSTVSGNQAARGAGILNENGELLVEFSTVTNNTGPLGAGIANLNNPDTFTQLSSSIISANVGTDVQILQSAVPNFQSLGFNLVGTGNALSVFSQPGDLPGITNPMLDPLVVDGGFSPVHRLQSGSPAIDTGASTAVAGDGNVPMYDQRGFPFTRVFDGLQDTKDRIDIGAYELQGTTFVVDTLLDENDGNISAGNLSLREAVELSNANPLPDVIMFDSALAGGTIQQSAMNDILTQALQPGTPTDIRITDSVTIIGLGQGLLTLVGGALTDAAVLPPLGEEDEPRMRSRFFTIDDGDNSEDINVTISDLTFGTSTNVTMNGGAVASHENLVIRDVLFTTNSTLGDANNGGALFQRYGNLLLDRVTFTANTTDGVDADGGAVYVRDADATVVDSLITGNSTAQTLGSGGGFYIRGGTLEMSGTTVSANLTPGGEADGAGVFGFESVLNISNSYISGNSMTGSNSEGAGIFAKDSTLVLTDALVTLNTTTGTQSEGAGIYLSGSNATIDNSIISLNTTSGLAATGGGIAVVDGELFLRRSTVDGNKTTGGDAPGGGIHNLGSDVTIVDSTVSGSVASGLGSHGAGVFSSTSLGTAEKTLILNSTISGGSSGASGGGVYNGGGLTEIRHSTITNNSVPFFGNGGGVASLGTAGTAVTRVYSSIISGNFASNDPVNPISDVDSPAGQGQNSFQSLGFNVIGQGLPLALGAFNAQGDQAQVDDPRLGLLTFGGGPTLTHTPLEDSPAVNAGDPSAIPGFANVPMNDQRGTGFPRLLGGRIDVGAVETPFIPTIDADFDGDGDVDGSDFLAWQRGYGTFPAGISDGDANDDNVVNNADLSIWQAEYGDGVALGAVAAASSSEVVAAPVLSATSEPLVAAAVQSETALPAGLTLEDSSLTENSVDDAVFEEQASDSLASRDQVFASISQRAAYRDLGEAESLDGENADSNEELEVALDDAVFGALGA